MHRLQVLICCGLAALALVCGTTGTARAQGRVILDSDVKAERGLYPIALPTPLDSDPELAKLVTAVQAFDLEVSSWFKILDPRSFTADLGKEGLGIEPQRWKDVGAFAVVKARVVSRGGRVTLEFRLFEMDKGAQPVLERRYEGTKEQTRDLVHRWCNEVVKHFTQEDGFGGSQIVFVSSSRGRKAIRVADFDGFGVRSVSNNSSDNILPALSPDGGQVAFTSYMRRNPDLYVTSVGGGRARRLVSFQGMNTGAAWSPDGSTIALTLSKDGNAEIYLVRASDGKVIKRLTSNRYIDTSPSWSPDGREIAFVSDREGGPQIFVMNADGSRVRRVSTVGGHNQTPMFCPMNGKQLIAYTARDDASGRFDIVTLDLATSKLVRITQNQGNNEEPTWSPNCRSVAFASSRPSGAGVYLSNADGTGSQRRIFSGAATAPHWGPVRKQP